MAKLVYAYLIGITAGFCHGGKVRLRLSYGTEGIMVQALILGAVVGAVFALFKMPVPAPATLAGVLGIVGLYGGWTLMGKLL
jgi:XapX domain-containing protein